ncbi:hypothetical protein D0Z67_25100 [Streptomyces seoulensis]|uniref:Uncharacterized protein n=2 Tax=Streptomyces seoulensis TaxID=73044 RepID=A0A4P6U050_STRSO|nr:hypothetical protein D0Z67_25100 [Streptomyces seoulensis]
MTGGRPRMPHTVVLLRWLRAGTLGMVAVTALLYLVVANGAEEQIAAADRTTTAIRHIGAAYDQAGAADSALEAVSRTGAIDLIGTSGDFANATARVSSHLTSATEGNAAGEQGLSHIQFVQGQLTTCVQSANTAVLDGSPGLDRARAALDDAPEYDGRRPVPFTGGLKQSLRDLKALEAEARDHQRGSGWRDPGLLRPLFLAPLAVMLLLTGVTGRLVVHRFRRYPGPALVLAPLVTASISIPMCTINPPDVSIALPVLAAAGALGYLAYRPRLAEYRFPRP